MNPDTVKYYQVSTLQALALGFSKSVITGAHCCKMAIRGLELLKM